MFLTVEHWLDHSRLRPSSAQLPMLHGVWKFHEPRSLADADIARKLGRLVSWLL